MSGHYDLLERLRVINPVTGPEHVDRGDLDAVRSVIEERRGVVTTMKTPVPRKVLPSRRRRLRPVLAFAAGLAIVLGSVGVAAVMLSGDDEGEVVTETTLPAPQTTTVPPTTSPPPMVPPPPSGPVLPAAYGDVPSFRGTVTYSQHDPTSADPGLQATIEVRFAGPMRFMYTVVDESADGVLGGPGTVFIGDGTDTWLYEAGDQPPWPVGVDPLRHVFYDSAQPSPPWGEICGPSPTRLGVETIAGRPASHIACSTTLEDYELWVDEGTGVVLKLRGPLAVGDFHPLVDRDGGFEFTELTLVAVTIPEVVLPEPVATGAFPPHHMVSTTDYGPGTETVEYWYRDDGALRQTVTAGTHPEVMVGYFTVVADGQISMCDPSGYEGECWTETIEEGGDYVIPLPSDQVPLQLVADHCDEGAQETIAGRTAQHFSCSGLWFDHRGHWVAVDDARAPDQEYWYDAATGLQLGYTHADGPSMQVEVLDVNPVFAEGVFDHELPALPDMDPYVLDDIEGVIAAWSGPLLDGTMFDLEDFRRPPGQPDPVPGTAFVVVYDWFPGCGDTCLDGIADFQALYEKYGTTDWDAAGTGYNIEFVSVVEDVVSAAQRTNERLGITVPTVACYIEEGEHDQIDACVPESPWFFWGNSVPSWTVLDTGGFLVYGVSGPDYDYAELDALLAQISGRDDGS